MRARSLIGLLLCVAVIMSVLLLVSCSSPRPPASSGTSTKEVKPYGSLVVAASFRTGAFDPMNSALNAFQALAAGVFDTLIWLTPDGQPTPGIAERWEISPDGKDHIFYIRRGVKFHDGSDLTGADVKFSIERVLSPQATTSTAPQWRAAIDKVELKDDFTVVVHLKKPLFEALPDLGSLGNVGAVVPKKYIEEKGADYFETHPVGSGPFKVLRYDPGSRLDLEAMDSHWRGVPKFKSVTLLNVPEEGTVVAMLKTGELDIAGVGPDVAAGLKAGGQRVVSHDGNVEYFMWPFWDMDNPGQWAFGDVRVRKALSLAIDRKEMGDKLYKGFADPGTLMGAPKSAYFYDSNVLKPDPYDAEGAKKLLTEAGYPAGFPTKIWNMGAQTVLSTFNTAIAGYWRKVGINAELAPIDESTVTKMYSPKHTPQIWNTVRTNLTGGGTFGFERMAKVYHSTTGAPHNIRNPKLDELIDKVPMTRDLAEKKRIALEAAVMAKNEYSTVAILNLQTTYAVGSKVGEMRPIQNMAGLTPVLEMITHAK